MVNIPFKLFFCYPQNNKNVDAYYYGSTNKYGKWNKSSEIFLKLIHFFSLIICVYVMYNIVLRNT